MPTSSKAVDGGRLGGPIIMPCVEVDLVWNIVPTKQVKNVLHATVGGGFVASAAIAQAIYAAILASAQWTAYKPFLNSACDFAGVNIRDLRTANQALFPSTGAATPGTGALLALPPGVCGLITLRTAQAGRGFRGRVYLPGLDSVCMNAATGLFTAAYQTAAQNFITEVGTALTASAMTHAIGQAHRQAYTGRTGVARADRPANAIVVTSNQMRVLNATSQRRRSVVA